MFDILFKKIVFISIKSPTFSIVGVGGHSHVSLSVESWGLSIYNVARMGRNFDDYPGLKFSFSEKTTKFRS